MTIFPKYFFKGFPAYACSGEDGLHRFPFDISRNQFADVSYFLPAAQVERLAPTANNYLSLTESPADGLSRNSDLFGELHDRNPGLIFQDRVIDVEIKELSTHVYDLATQCGYYVSNGIVTHNCTIAAIGHAIQTWTTASSQSLTVPDSTILEYYEKWDGYNPADPRSDQGGVELDILNDWRQQGFSGQSLEAYVAIELRDSGQAANRVIGRSGDRVSSENTGSPDQRTARSNDSAPLSIKGRQADQPITGSPDQALPEIATAIWLFGGAYIGVELPIRAQNQDVWDVPTHPGSDDEPGSWGGHAIYLVGYDRKMAIDDCRLSIEKQSTIGNGQSSVDNRQSTITCITWGRPKKMTWAWFQKYCSEAYALVSKAWLKASGVAPCGFDLATLEADLELVTT